MQKEGSGLSSDRYVRDRWRLEEAQKVLPLTHSVHCT